MPEENIISRINDEYEALRTRAAQRRRRSREAAFLKAPRLKELERELNEAGAMNTAAVMREPHRARELNERFKKRVEELEAERIATVRENGVDPSYNDYVYACPVCRDTGYDAGNKRCRCFEQKLINYAYADSNLGVILEEQCFENFDLALYPNDKYAFDNVTVREYMKNVYDKCLAFAERSDSVSKGLLFYGGSGLGKTFLSSCIAKRLMDSGKSVIYTRATRLFSMYEDYKFSRVDTAEARHMINRVYSCDFLIIDDLGTEAYNKNTLAFLFDILNERHGAGRKMLISTNLDPQELERIYSARFVSRMYEYFYVLEFLGEDIRKIKENL